MPPDENFDDDNPYKSPQSDAKLQRPRIARRTISPLGCVVVIVLYANLAWIFYAGMNDKPLTLPLISFGAGIFLPLGLHIAIRLSRERRVRMDRMRKWGLAPKQKK
jgi:hypothetical protein